MCTACLALTDVFDKQMTVAENIRPQRRDVDVSRDGKCFYQAVALRRVETGNEKHREISQLSSSLFQKNPKVFELPLFAISIKNTVTVFSTLKFSIVISSADLTD